MPFKSLLNYSMNCYTTFTGITKRVKLDVQEKHMRAPLLILISNDGLLQRLITIMRTREEPRKPS